MSDSANTQVTLEGKQMTSQHSSQAQWLSTERRQLVLPLKQKTGFQKSGRIDPKFLQDNGIHLVHYTETTSKNVRRIVIAYKYEKGSETVPSQRNVTYGACVFKTSVDSKESFDRRGHNWTAINRLLTRPVKVELHFHTVDQFNKDLRKCLFKYHVQGHKQHQMKQFVLNMDTVQGVLNLENKQPQQMALEQTSS
jgi:hypothetical protein